jgi:hypothetical protein
MYDFRYNASTNKYCCHIIVLPNHRNLSINSYKDAYIDVPVANFPFLYAHYQAFISLHFGIKQNIEQIYRDIILNDPVFKHLCECEPPIDKIINKQFRQYLMDQELISVVNDEYYVNTIIKHKMESDKTYYLVWWDHLPYQDASWEPEEHLSEHSKIEYSHRLERRYDQDYA